MDPLREGHRRSLRISSVIKIHPKDNVGCSLIIAYLCDLQDCFRVGNVADTYLVN